MRLLKYYVARLFFPWHAISEKKRGVTNEWQTMTVNGDTGDDYWRGLWFWTVVSQSDDGSERLKRNIVSAMAMVMYDYNWLRLGKDSLYECFKASVPLNVIEESDVMIMMIFTSEKAWWLWK